MALVDQKAARPTAAWHLFVPKLIVALREGYGLADARADLFAGLTVAVVAIPLSLALAIASGVSPERGLFTAIVAGVVVSALGGSRHQIAGPTGAFVVVVAGIVQKFGYEGLVIATVLAGFLLIATGAARIGSYIKFIPLPVVTGFTTGIALVIFASQLGDIFGLQVQHVPPSAVDRLAADFLSVKSVNPYALATVAGTLGVILLVQSLAPRAPAFFIAILLAGIAAWTFKLPITTIGMRFGSIPAELPAPQLPVLTLASLSRLLPSAFTIYVLAGIESLLSAVVADGMTGRRHRSNCELVAQGFANISSALFGGIPASGAIARTATNIRAGARTPIAGIVHSLAIALLMALFAPFVGYLPLPALGAVLAVVCWNMSELNVFGLILRGPLAERAVLIATFLLTVFVDLSFAIAAGVGLAAIFFAKSLARSRSLRLPVAVGSEDIDEIANPNRDALVRADLPKGVEVLQLNGPLFFAAAMEHENILARTGGAPKVLILRMGNVPLIDSTAATTFKRFLATAKAHKTTVVLAELKEGPADALARFGIQVPHSVTFKKALAISRSLAHHE